MDFQTLNQRMYDLEQNVGFGAEWRIWPVNNKSVLYRLEQQVDIYKYDVKAKVAREEIFGPTIGKHEKTNEFCNSLRISSSSTCILPK